MRSENKVRIIVGLTIVFAWILYINFIYGGSATESMDTVRCGLNITAGTDTCRGISSYLGGYP